MSNVLRKLTIANTGWTKQTINAALVTKFGDEKNIVPNGSKLSLMTIVGVTTSFTPGQTALGEFLKLRGDFTAVNLDDGTTYSANVALLPNFISDQIAAALEQSDRVEFALRVGVESNSASATGYVFTVESLLPAKPTESMQRLMNMAQADFKSAGALEAPKADTAGSGGSVSDTATEAAGHVGAGADVYKVSASGGIGGVGGGTKKK